LSFSTRPNAVAASNVASASASAGKISPAASGRSRVRATRPSKLRSAKSFSAQPAERISSVPTPKIATSSIVGWPRAASHTAHRVGHSKSRVPTGLSSRSSRS
jgi:hypothetical protein